MPALSIEAKNHLAEGGEILKECAEILQSRTVSANDLMAVHTALQLFKVGLEAHILAALVTEENE